MRTILLILIVTLASCKATKVSQKTEQGELGPNPYFEIDGRPVNNQELQSYNPNQVASLIIYYDEDATNLFGDKAKDGAVVVTSKEASRKKYQALFSSESKDYKRIIGQYDESEIQYTLNERILELNFEGDLATINDKRLKRISIISQEDLVKKYSIDDKKIGVVIKAKAPKDLVNADKKF